MWMIMGVLETIQSLIYKPEAKKIFQSAFRILNESWDYQRKTSQGINSKLKQRIGTIVVIDSNKHLW